MYTIEHNTVIRRPIEDVFAFLSNMENRLKWEASVVEAEQMSRPLGVGSTTREVRKTVGLHVTTHYVITEYDPYRTYAFRSTGGPLSLAGRYLIEPVREGTRVAFTLHLQPEGILRLLGFLFARQFQKDVALYSENLKHVLESRGDRSPARRLASGGRRRYGPY